ncbi:SRPBCC domain-containing protein [Flavobacteriaceae bacterium KMM 6898]|nr:SRPBCC domain-containing protein [Flavobacteriaceae bacterium KMM 6898]
MIKQPRDIPIIVEQEYHVPINVLWESITNLQHMKLWFFNNIPAFEPVVGFKTSFEVQSGEHTFTHLWHIIKAVPNKKITYHWSYTECEGEGLVTFELFDEGNKSSLRLTNVGLETFPDDLPEFTRESVENGWDYFIKQSLKNYLKANNS